MDLEPPRPSRPKKTQSTCAAGQGRESRRDVADGRLTARPGAQAGEAAGESARPAARRGPGAPKGPGAAPQSPPRDRSRPDGGWAPTAEKAPRCNHGVASVRPFPRGVRLSRAPPASGVPGLGSERRLTDPNPGAPPGAGPEVPDRPVRNSAPAPSHVEGNDLLKAAPSGTEARRPGVGRVAGDPERGQDES